MSFVILVIVESGPYYFQHWCCQRCRGGVEAFSSCSRCAFTGMEYGYFAAPGAILPWVQKFYWAEEAARRFRPIAARRYLRL